MYVAQMYDKKQRNQEDEKEDARREGLRELGFIGFRFRILRAFGC